MFKDTTKPSVNPIGSDTPLKKINVVGAGSATSQPVAPVNPSVTSARPASKTSLSVSTKLPWWKRRRARNIAIGVSSILAIVLLVVGALGFWTYSQVKQIQAHAQSAATEGRAVYDAFKAQNLPAAKSHLMAAQGHMLEAETVYKRMAFAKAVPVARGYYKDGEAGFTAGQAGVRAGMKFFEAVEPHADLLGFTGEETYLGTTEDRVALVLETLGQIAPQLDGIAEEIEVVKQNLDQIDPQDYPENFRGYPVRSLLQQAKGGAEAAEIALNEARPALERLPTVAGATGDRRKYLVIFQNDNELRPTGGFMTAYAVIYVENGKVTAEKSDDIYELDKRFANKPPIPPILGKYLTSESRWNLRDMNVDPSFEESMKTFYEHYSTIRGEAQDIDGIIAVDTEMLQKIVEVIGPIDVPGYGTFSTQKLDICDCSQIVYMLSEIIDRPTPYIRENRKGILAPMMQSLIQKTYATPRDKWPLLAQIGWEGIQGRHVQMYFFDEQDQAAARAINAAGVIPDMPAEGDYLTVIDANLAGAKSNLFIETSTTTKVMGVENGRVQKEVEITYRNTHPPSNCNLEAGQLCLNGMLNDWSRWYVPKGVEVTEALGFKDGYTLDTTNPNYDIIEGFFTVAPLGQTKVRVTYSVPYALEDRYELFMQKQGGLDVISAEVITPWGTEELEMVKDTKFTFDF